MMNSCLITCRRHPRREVYFCPCDRLMNANPISSSSSIRVQFRSRKIHKITHLPFTTTTSTSIAIATIFKQQFSQISTLLLLLLLLALLSLTNTVSNAFFQANSNNEINFQWPKVYINHENGQFNLDSNQQAIKKLKPFHELYPDAYLDPPEFIRLRHFIPESHHVVTKDNYVLTIHRVINPLVPNELRHKLKPIFLQHGLFTSSFNFIIASDRNNDRPRFDVRDLSRTKPLNVYTPESFWTWKYFLDTLNDLTLAKLGLTKQSDRFYAPHITDSLAFELANQGYDVWMGNARGSTYSLNHTQYDFRNDWRYWDFSFHEMALYDLPAQIDYVLRFRNRRSLSYIGHSQGNLAMFILQSFQPDWADKIKPFVAMAPIAFVPDVYNGLFRTIIKAISPVVTPKRLNEILKGQILPKSETTAQALDLVCVPKATTIICDAILSIILGENIKRANHSLTPIVAHHIPEGTSILNMLHFGQMIESGQFRSFDFGPEENVRRYGQSINPFYPIKNIRSPDIAFVVGRTDPLSTMSNVAITRSMLNVPLMDDYIVSDPIWGHADYMYAIGAGRIANSHMIGLCDRYRLVP